MSDTTRKKCWYCRKRYPPPGSRSCEICRKKQRDSQRKRRDEARAAGFCGHCMRRKAMAGTATCRTCLKAAAENKSQLFQERRDSGLCPLCGESPKPGFVHCRKHLKEISERQRGRIRANRTSSSRTELQQARRENHECVVCGAPAKYEPETKTYRRMCRKHLKQAADSRRQNRRGE